MAITIDYGRQWALEATVSFAFGDLTSGAATDAVKLPPGAVVHGGRVYTDTAWNSGTSDTLSVGDSVSATRYINASATALRTAALNTEFASTANGFKYAAGGTIQVTITRVGTAATAGAARMYVRYTNDTRANEVQQ
jgi:hypothetical protein